MANSSDVVAGNPALATDYNDLRKDVLDGSSGHRHGGTEGATLFGILNINNPATGLNYADDTNYQAPYDLFVILTGAGVTELFHGTSSPASNLICKSSVATAGCMMPVKKGDWWRTKNSSGSLNIYVMWIGGTV